MTEFDREAAEHSFEKPPVRELIAALEQETGTANSAVSSTVVYGLSDLSSEDLRKVAAVWRRRQPSAKHQILRALNEASEAMFELNFSAIARLSLEDRSAMVRVAGVELLWTDETPQTMRQLLQVAANDSDSAVRASALSGLGRFILLGEYGDIPAALAKRAQDLALRLHQDRDQPLEVRRRALEALANSSHPMVSSLIRAAYADGNHDLKIGALFAMGRSCSSIWRDILLEELSSGDDESVYEAIQACGQIQIAEGVQRIGELTLSEDREIQLMAIWALGEIGGKHAFEILSSLAEARDDELGPVIGEALDSASFSMSFARLGSDLRFD